MTRDHPHQRERPEHDTRKIPVRDKRAPRDETPPSGVGPEQPPEVEDPSDGDDASPAAVALKAELEQAWKLAGDRLEQLKRLKADHENMKSRVARERSEQQDRAAASICERLLPVLDDLERAMESARAADVDPVTSGLELVVKQFHEALGSVGVEKMEVEGSPFDPHAHEAMSSVPGDVEAPTVSAVIRPGYRIGDRTLRPALVMVTTPASEPEEDEG